MKRFLLVPGMVLCCCLCGCPHSLSLPAGSLSGIMDAINVLNGISTYHVVTVTDAGGRPLNEAQSLLAVTGGAGVGFGFNVTEWAVAIEQEENARASGRYRSVSAAGQPTEVRFWLGDADPETTEPFLTVRETEADGILIWVWTVATPTFTGTGTIPAGTTVQLAFGSRLAR